MRAGFVQNLQVTTLQAKYGDALTVATSSLQNNQQGLHWDTKPGPFKEKFYSAKPEAFFENPTPTNKTAPIFEDDSPYGGAPINHNGATLRYITLKWDLKLYVVALTRDIRNGANGIYTAQALGEWTFNGTGSVNPQAGGYPWTGAPGVYGITPPPTGWVPVTNGTQPKTDGNRFNQAVIGQTWS